jgi:hypothetical protein
MHIATTTTHPPPPQQRLAAAHGIWPGGRSTTKGGRENKIKESDVHLLQH